MIKIEMTDTFGGDANYSWVKRMKIEDDKLTNRQILKKIRDEFELGKTKLVKVLDTGDMLRYDLSGYCQCIFIMWEY